MTNQELQKNNSSTKNVFVSICLAQTVCIAVILIAAFIIKFFFKDEQHKLRKWCSNNVFEKTQVNDVFDEESE